MSYAAGKISHADFDRPNPGSAGKPPAYRQAFLSIVACSFAGCGDRDEKTTIDDHPAAVVVQETLDRYDDNNDGALSEAERKVMESDFVERFDTDGDGFLNGTEKATARRNSKSTVVTSSRAPLTRKAVVEFLGRFDSDGDGKLSEAEAGEKRWKVMGQADRDGDGVLTADEWHAHNLRPQAAAISE